MQNSEKFSTFFTPPESQLTSVAISESNIGATDPTTSEISLVSGKVYNGIVTKTNPMTQLMEVAIGNHRIQNCIYAAQALASIFGVTTTSVLPVGTPVIVAYTGASAYPVILSSTGFVPASSKFVKRTISGDRNDSVAGKEEFRESDENMEYTAMKRGEQASSDLLPGELELTSGLGTSFRLLYNFAQLSASDAAKIEACLLNDMVRIVDNYFVHHTCGGDELIWESGGYCTKENHFSSVLYEAEGKVKAGDELAKKESAEFVYSIPDAIDDPYTETGRWRLSQYYGFLGDMVHRWVTSPTEVMSNIMEGSFRTGQYRSWVGSDGTLLIQAAGGVQIEVTQHIVIPSILKAWNSPDFDMKKALEDLNSEFLKVWGSGPDWDDMKVAVWQLNYYSKYIALWKSLTRFRQLQEKQFCKIPTEKSDDVPDRTPTADEADRDEAVPSANYPMPQESGHAILSMDTGGSIALVSGGNTSIVLNNGSMQLACPGNIELQAGGSVILQGKNVAITGAQNVAITSLFGSLIMKARTKLAALCEAGVLWLKGDASKEKLSDVPENPLGKSESTEPELREYSVVIDASEGKTLVHGATGVSIGTTEDESDIDIRTIGQDSAVAITSNKDIDLRARTGTIFSHCKDFIAQATNIGLFGQLIKLSNMAVIKKGVLHVRLIYAQLVSAFGSFIGRSKYIAQKEDMSDYEPDLETIELDDLQQEKVKEGTDMLNESFIKTEFGEDCVFKLSSWTTNDFSQNILDTTSLKAPFLVEWVDANDEAKETLISTDTSEESLKVMQATRTQTDTPFPGSIVQVFKSSADESDKILGKAWEEDFSSNDIKSAKDMSLTQYTYIFRKNEN